MGFLRGIPHMALVSTILALIPSQVFAKKRDASDPWEKETHCEQQSLNQVCQDLLETTNYNDQCFELCEAAENTESDCVSKCAEALQTQEVQSQILAQCLAIEYTARTKVQSIIMGSLNAAAAGLCAPQCFNPAAKQGIRVSCKLAGTAIAAADLTYTLILKSLYSQKIQVMTDVIWPAGGAVLGLALPVIMNGGKKGGAGGKAAGAPPPAPPAEAPAEPAPSASSDQNGFDRLMDCFPFLGFTARAATTSLSLIGHKQSIADACTALGALLSENGTITPAGPAPDIQLGIDLGNLGASNQGAEEQYSDGTGSTTKAVGKDALGSFDNIAQTSEAIAKKSGNKFDRSALKSFYDSAKGLGIDFPSLSKQVQSQGATAALNGLLDRSGLSRDEINAAKKMGQNLDVYASKNMSGLYSVGGGKKAAGSAKDAKDKDPFAKLFGGGPAGGLAAQGGTQSFDPNSGMAGTRMAPASEEDIFHPGYPGTLFDLISEKTRIVLPRVDELEWDYVLNRAFHQLPKKDPNSPAVKVRR